jgi:branched-chain amino acid transport system ATP-binding protein
MTDPRPMLSVKNLTAHYGAAQVLFGISLDVRPGEVVALMGRNGAGKSTTLRTIMGLVPQRTGRVSFEDHDISRTPTHLIAKAGLGYVPEDRRIFTELSVMENLDVGRQPPRRLPDGRDIAWTPEALFELFPNLGEMRDRPGGRMSGGEQQMLTIARTLMGNPSLVLLDEPSEGVAPLIVEAMAKTVLDLKRRGLAILLSEQNIHFASLLADRAYVLEKGEVKFAGPMAALMADDALRAKYLAV